MGLASPPQPANTFSRKPALARPSATSPEPIHSTGTETAARSLDRTVIWIQRLGSLYPYYRCPSLLRHLNGKTGNVPMTLLYPGERKDKTDPSFMGEMPADRDYPPRIYSAEMFH